MSLSRLYKRNNEILRIAEYFIPIHYLIFFIQNSSSIKSDSRKSR